MGERKLSAVTLAWLAGFTGIFDSLQFVSMGFLGLILGTIEAGTVFVSLNQAGFNWSAWEFGVTYAMSVCPFVAMSYPWLRFVGACSAQDLLNSLEGAPVAETVKIATTPPSTTPSTTPPAQKTAA
jgi:hypothetical protein